MRNILEGWSDKQDGVDPVTARDVNLLSNAVKTLGSLGFLSPYPNKETNTWWGVNAATGQYEDTGVQCNAGVLSANVADNLLGQSHTDALSAYQGFVLNNKINAAVNNLYGESLTINPDFQVWQKGRSFTFENSTENNIYCGLTADRWQLYLLSHSSVTVEKVQKGIKITLNGKCELHQVCEAEDSDKLRGRKAALSFKIRSMDGLLMHAALQEYGGAYQPFVLINSVSAPGEYSKIGIVDEGFPIGKIGDYLYLEGNGAIELEYFKHSPGKTPGFMPRAYGQELALCQRYRVELNSTQNVYAQVGIGTASKTDTCYVMCPVPAGMPVNPTLTYSGAWKLITGNETRDITAMVCESVTNNMAIIRAESSNLTVGAMYILRSQNNAGSLLLDTGL